MTVKQQKNKLSCSAYNVIRSSYFTALTLKELFENTNSLHISYFIKDIDIQKFNSNNNNNNIMMYLVPRLQRTGPMRH